MNLSLACQIMKFLNKATVYSFLKRWLSWENWQYWLIPLVVILFIVLFVFFMRRKRAGAAPSLITSFNSKISQRLTASGAPAPQEAEQTPLSRSTLIKIWNEFLKEIPRMFRRSIMSYQPFVVIGEAGVGKTLLVDNYTDWKGQACQFYPSYTANPLLQIYLGSKAVVQEIPSALLNDTSKEARAALLKLWKPLFKRKEPLVVVVLNGAELQSDAPESLKRQAQMIRGKINILSFIRKKSVNVCIALTHMDHIEGYSQFSDFLRKNDIPLRFEFNSKTDLQNLKTCLDSYEDYLTHALTTLPAKDYLKIISFMRNAPELFSVVSTFANILKSPDPLSSKPEIIRLNLVSQNQSDANISNPFVSSISSKEIQKFPLLFKHQFAAAALVILGLAYMGLGYVYERKFLIETDQKMNVIETSPYARYNEEWRQLLPDFSSGLKKNPMLTILPNFFPDVSQNIRLRLAHNIRTIYLLPQLYQLIEEEDKREKILYLLALLYASQHNDLGKFILNNEHVAQWTNNLDISANLVEDYINTNSDFQASNLLIDDLSLYNQKITLSHDPQPWMVFFREIDKISKNPSLTQTSLSKLQREADLFLHIIQDVNNYNLSAEISKLLKQETNGSIQTDWIQKRDSQIKQESIRELLLFLKKRDIVYPNVKNLNFSQFLENIRVMMELSVKNEEKFHFTFADKKFLFNAQNWNELIDRSRITLFMRDFIAHNKRHDGLLFFHERNRSADIVMNPSNDGLLFFTGKGRVDERFTKNAFEENVKLVLLDLPEFLENLPIEEKEKTLFSAFVFKEVEAYSEQYVSEFLNYYWQFGMEAGSLLELRYLLAQIQLPSSTFQDFLLTIKENTALELGENQYFRPFILELKNFDFIKHLMQERKGELPEFERYKAILGQMQADIEGNEPPPETEDKNDVAKELKNLLSPVGRMSLIILREERDSYLSIVKKWLKSAGVAPDYQDVFIAPVYLMYEIGLTEVETVVDKLWTELWESDIQPLLNTFPFSASAESDISPQQLGDILRPQGHFWKTFKQFLSPVLQQTEITWNKRTSVFGSLQLPKNMLKRVNNIARLTKMFWNKEGISQPFKLSIKPLPLPLREKGWPVAVLSYMKSGGSSVFGFNQQPSWETLHIEWWKDQIAAVGIEFKTSDDSLKIYREIVIPESPWSFYRLLLKANAFDTNVMTWKINNDGKELSAQFAIKNDPWALIQLNSQ